MKATLLIFRTPHAACLLAIATLAGAFAFQHVGGMEPCPICIWQRWPYAAGIALIAAGIGLGKTRLAPFLFGAALVTFLGGDGLSAWHAGIEYGFWAGPASCGTETNLGNLSGEALLDALEAKPMVRCDVPQWTLVGVSLAGWSLLAQVAISLLLVPTLRESSLVATGSSVR